jgi:hypothetical protein
MTSGSHNTHAVLAPSSAKRWVHCTVSAGCPTPVDEDDFDESFMPESEDLDAPETEESEDDTLEQLEAPEQGEVFDWAQDGTFAHDLAAQLLTGAITEAQVPTEFLKPVMRYVNGVRGLMDGAQETHIEYKVPLYYSPEDTGTLDFGVVKIGELIIDDLKYGFRRVLAHNNPQLAIYARSLAEKVNLDGLVHYGPEDLITLRITQPRMPDLNGGNSWTITFQELKDFLAPIDEAAALIRSSHYQSPEVRETWERILSADPTLDARAAVEFLESDGLVFAPSPSACEHCPARTTCPVRLAQAVSPTSWQQLTDAPKLSRKESKLPVEERLRIMIPESFDFVAIWKNRNVIKKILTDVAIMLKRDLPPGVKLVQGNDGKSTWADEAEAMKFLARKLKLEERTTRKLISPTKARELLENFLDNEKFAAKFNALVVRPEGKPTLALEDDKRPALSNSFDQL